MKMWRRRRRSTCAATARTATAALLLGAAAIMTHVAEAKHLGGKRDTIHRVDKVHVTVKHLKRDGDQCPASHHLCPASFSGGCCPDAYGCTTDSCFATTAGSASQCGGRKGYYPCGIENAGGCCPEGYICNRGGCQAPAGVSYSLPCPNGYFVCPSSLGSGCCMNGMGCAQNACYSTAPSTYVLTRTFTMTTEGSRTVTRTSTTTTVTTPTPPPGLPTDTNAAIPKFIVTSLPKVPATTLAPSSGGGGLTSAQIGGIVAGVVVLFIVVVAATLFIIRRLNQTQRVLEESQKGSSDQTTSKSKQQSTSQYTGRYTKPTINGTSQLDSMEYDDLLQHTNLSSTSAAPTPSLGTGPGSPEDPSSRRQTPYLPGSPGEGAGHNTGYFEMPPRSQTFPRHSTQSSAGFRISTDSQGTAVNSIAAHDSQPRNRARHHSNASEGSNVSYELPSAVSGPAGFSINGVLGSPGLPAELENTSTHPELQGSDVCHPLHAHHRSRSGNYPPHARDRSGSSLSSPPLDVVSETVEMMHGYYGPVNRAAGQTQAGLRMMHDISSPLATRFTEENFPPPTESPSQSRPQSQSQPSHPHS